MSGIYIHIPFCKSKCGYCAFFSTAAIKKYLPLFPDAIADEARSRSGEVLEAVDTLYIGGGTPSLLPPDVISQIVTSVANTLHFDPHHLNEFTIEVNPDDVTPQKADLWKTLGVNRISLGVQTFDNEELLTIGRRHTAEAAIEAIKILKSRFDNISIDLIFGLPRQSFDSWKRSLQSAIDLKPQHLSAYSLTFEERTRFTLLRERGEIHEADEDLSESMYALLVDKMREAGYEHYEISNFARQGFRSIHNSSYWAGIPYLGLGPAASSYDGHRCRRTNHPSLETYLHRFAKGIEESSQYYEIETLTDEELSEEFVLTRLRTDKGIEFADFSNRFGADALQRLKRRAVGIKQSLLRIDPTGIALTEEGFFVSDEVILDLI